MSKWQILKLSIDFQIFTVKCHIWLQSAKKVSCQSVVKYKSNLLCQKVSTFYNKESNDVRSSIKCHIWWPSVQKSVNISCQSVTMANKATDEVKSNVKQV